MSAEAGADAETPGPCAVCDSHEDVAMRHLGPLGNFVEVAVCSECAADWGTVAPQDEVGPQAGIDLGDVCIKCAPEDAGDAEQLFAIELEFKLAGQVGHITGRLCEQHAREQAAALLDVGGGEG